MKKQTTQMWVVGMYGLVAIMWTIRFVVLLTDLGYNGPFEIDVMLCVLCVVVWWIAFLVQVMRYRKGKKGGS